MAAGVQDVREAIKTSWGAAAEGWNRWFDWYAVQFGPSIAWCCDAVARPGARVLDLGCGTGQPALPIARGVVPGGRVVATDLAPEMLAVARARAREAGVENIEFREMDAQDLQFADASFDAVTFAYGLMFCPDPARTIAGIRRVLKPGGRFAVVVWDDPSKSPFLTLAGRQFARVFPPAPPAPDAPGAFRFAAPGALESALRDGGFRDILVESRPMTLECASPAEYWRMFTDHAAGVSAKLAQMDDTARAALEAAVEEAARPYVVDGCVRLVATPLCAVATR